ncbi:MULTISPECIES: LysR family transcriptional regulator [Neptunomonas]|uniref:LysR family transcriptional regulator n=1 Tax=Neptunomonas marina TaxID=1815562 RepID=A0A437Q8H2_9GAMM|nr:MULTISPECIES: LysR family transcriptional regulator [Neptunomonas]RVU30643.1 LysR family transcriptional regulator [Neptunomonas marina]
MDIEALRSFLAFVDTGSFTRAAKQLHRTQGAISMQMKRLEEEAGKSLFIKEGRQLALTEHGRKLVSYARRIVAMHDDALGDLQRGHEHPPIIIASPDDYAESVLPKVMAQLVARHPTQTFKLLCDNSTNLRRMLDNGEIHAAILTRAPEHDEGYLLHHERGVWVHGGHAELFDREVLPLALYEAQCKFHTTAIDGLEKALRPYHLLAASSSATAIKALLREGLAVSAMAVSSLSPDMFIVERPELPELPAVDIVLALSSLTHPLLSASEVASVAKVVLQQQTLEAQQVVIQQAV